MFLCNRSIGAHIYGLYRIYFSGTEWQSFSKLCPFSDMKMKMVNFLTDLENMIKHGALQHYMLFLCSNLTLESDSNSRT